MTKAIDLVTRALKDVGAYAPGEIPDAADANDAFDMLNDLIDQWSNSTMMVPYITEIVFSIATNVYRYTIGNGGTVGQQITASISGTVLTVSVTDFGDIALGQYLSGAGVLPNTQITQFITGAGGVGTYEVNNFQNVSSETMSTYYQRPLRINSAFVRVATIDYPITILNVENYNRIGLKALNGPWPKYLYYQPSSPLGNLTFWPVPGAGEVHMFVDTILNNFNSLADSFDLPQGYAMALRWNLAELLLPMFGQKDPTRVSLIQKAAASSREWVKSTNMQPPPQASFDDALLTQNRKADAAWFLSGGFLP
jgi:hypothetical protein